jgi:alkylhydroperoxidase family enzyme
MTRLPYPDPETIPEEIRTFMARLVPLNVVRMIGHAPHLVRPFTALGTGFLIEGKIDPVLRECVILRVGYRSDAVYEFTQHEAIGRKLGMSEALFDAVRAGPDAAGLTAVQSVALRFTDHLMENPRPHDTELERIMPHFSSAQIAELVLLIGYYMMVCRFLETFGVDIESSGPGGGALLDRH